MKVNEKGKYCKGNFCLISEDGQLPKTAEMMKQPGQEKGKATTEIEVLCKEDVEKAGRLTSGWRRLPIGRNGKG